jgi:hypothetical protein
LLDGTISIDAGVVTGATSITTAGLTVTGAFTSLGIDDNADAIAMTIDSSENIGISRTAYTSGTTTGAWFYKQTGNPGVAHFGNNSDSECTLVLNNQGDGNMLQCDKSGTTKFIVKSGGYVGIGTTTPVTDLTIEGPITIKEQADADGDTAAYGQIWVNTATPNELYFTTDAGNDIQITSGSSIAATSGVSHATAWYVTTAYDVDNGDAIISTWTEMSNTYGGGQIGASMAHSSGIFTFPVTGIWQITADIELYAGNIDIVQHYTAIQTSQNNGSSFQTGAYGKAGRSSGPSNVYSQTHASFLFDVSSISGGTTRKLKIHQYTSNDAVTIAGGATLRSYVTFIKLN